jgi:hypothetical protein
VEAPHKEVEAWFAGRLPDDWFVEPPTVQIDRDEIVVIGELAEPQLKATDDADDTVDPEVARSARISGFREDTRDQRMRVAEEAQARWDRIVSWGASCGERHEVFTNANVPVMTRLRIDERQILDTLIDAGVARSRSEALSWCVELVGKNESDWIGKLRDAMTTVEEVRSEGPASG